MAGFALVEIWVAKKVVVFLAASAYGFPQLYRAGLRLNNRVVGLVSSDTFSHKRCPFL